MSAVALRFEPSAATRQTSRAKVRGVLRVLLRALERLVPPPGASQHAELPAEWFKYPPI